MTDTTLVRAQASLRSFAARVPRGMIDVRQAFAFNALLDRLSQDTGDDLSGFKLTKDDLVFYHGEYVVRRGPLEQHLNQAASHLEQRAHMRSEL